MKSRNSVLPNLEKQHIDIKIDYLPSIAHNKIIIIDGKITITGSFNFSHAAQFKNAENVLIIQDVGLAKQYINNWLSREKVSVSVDDYLALRRLH
jgi:phospholipase D